MPFLRVCMVIIHAFAGLVKGSGADGDIICGVKFEVCGLRLIWVAVVLT
jgi:hypothetical protein